MTIRLKLELASGQSMQGAPLELLADGRPVARGVVDKQGYAVFETGPVKGALAVRVDRSILPAG
ncbi:MULTISPECIES: hypothetical protein [unclassified Pseudomonas]|uniref:hypothetical protein n=1 Tax=unclassified Pseudomonas TaxID=196821 RepID=UPI000A1D7FB3|nr:MULTISPECIES: hypothetical protein [unclassified Pseudomonas]